ncbi:MAG: ROK family protein [Gammaproteobacteria bacterium]|nr:ROK family protein [Gammaproteobacteria bacterium]
MHLGVDVGGTKIEAVVLAADGSQRFRERIAAPQGSYRDTLAAIAGLHDRAEAACGGLDSVGLGAPGSVIPETGLMKNCNSTWLNGQPLPQGLADRLGRSVVVANDADCFALSEASDGAGAGERVVFGVILGTGVGGGVVVDGRLLAGPNGIAGEWGHNPLPDPAAAPAAVLARHRAMPARQCYCGRTNCVETWLSGPGLLQSVQAMGCEVATTEAAVAAAATGDAAAAAALELHQWQLAAALSVVINVLDPDVIVLGGGLSQVGLLYDGVVARWDRFVFSDRVRTRLAPPRFGDASGVRGAAWLGRRSGQ